MRHKLFFVWAQLKQFVLFSSSRFATLNLFYFFCIRRFVREGISALLFSFQNNVYALTFVKERTTAFKAIQCYKIILNKADLSRQL
jgi:hypothetical protein